MKVNVTFYSFLSSLLGVQQLEIDLPQDSTVTELSQKLQKMFQAHSSVFENATYLLNQGILTPEKKLEENSEILILISLNGG